MEELKLLIEAVAGLPTITLWVLVGYLIYKLAIIGSTYGVIRYALDTFIKWKNKPDEVVYKIGDNAPVIDDQVANAILREIRRIRSTSYIHMSDVNDLRIAIDGMIDKRKKV